MRFVMKYILSVFLVLLAGVANAGEKRQLDSHEHGHGTLNIAVEGKKLEMELEIPGADIVGFEHKAKSKQDKEAIKNAKKLLAKPLSLFVMPKDAKCEVVKAKVHLTGEDKKHDHHDHHKNKHKGHDHGHKKHKAHSHDHGHKKKHKDHKHEANHNEFHAEYEMKCADIKKIKSIQFDFFKTFKGSEELDVTIISGKGQKRFEVERKETKLDTTGTF